jgi:RNase P subunit RPR2
MARKQLERKIQVFCKHCQMWVNEENTKFVNIEEDMQGADILTFVCSDCGQTSKSRRYG